MSDSILDQVQSKYAAVAASTLSSEDAGVRAVAEAFGYTPEELASNTGIPLDRFEGLEAGQIVPTGDEVLIIADFFQCDYRFFVSNERLAAFQQTETLYRKFGNDFTKNDRRICVPEL